MYKMSELLLPGGGGSAALLPQQHRVSLIAGKATSACKAFHTDTEMRLYTSRHIRCSGTTDEAPDGMCIDTRQEGPSHPETR